jgi:hypothetical protein
MLQWGLKDDDDDEDDGRRKFLEHRNTQEEFVQNT